MTQIFSDVFGELSCIGRNVVQSFREDLFFRKRSFLSDEDKKDNKILQQHAVIRTLQDQASFNSSVITNLEREIARMNQLLADKDKELEEKRSLLKSMELRLHEETTRNVKRR